MRPINYLLGFWAMFAAWLPWSMASAADRMHMIIVQSVTVAGGNQDVENAARIHDDWKRITQTNGRLVWVVQDLRQGNRAKVLAAIEQLGEVGQRDVVVFYFTGHGATDEKEGSYLHLDDRDYITRSELRQKLKRLGARLTLIVTDCPAPVAPLQRKNTGQNLPKAPPRPPDRVVKELDPPEVAQKIFGNLTRLFAVNGLVDMNACSKGQEAWATKSGGFFTMEFKRILSTERVDDWSGFTQTLQKRTEESYSKFRERNLAQGGKPDTLGELELEELKECLAQSPEVFVLDVKKDEGKGNVGGMEPVVRPLLAPKRVALLVGVNRYLKPGLSDLRFAERDVRQVAEELKKQGFAVKMLLGSGEGSDQATRENVLHYAREMVKLLGKKDLALVMLSGHGQQIQQTDANGKVREDAYFVPVEGTAGRPSTLVSLSELTDDILANEVGRKLLLVDACRDVSKATGRGKGIQGKVIALPEDTAIFFACRAGQQSYEDETLKHGLFTYCLLEGLRGKAARDNEVSWTDLIGHVQRRMDSAEIRKFIPEAESQQPIAAGGVEHTVLAKIDAAEPRPLPEEPKP